MNTPNERTVTAQDFLGAMHIENHEDRLQSTWHGSARRIVVGRWDALLSRARQEARREALKEMDEANRDVNVDEEITRRYGRSEAQDRINQMSYDRICKLRQEYQQSN